MVKELALLWNWRSIMVNPEILVIDDEREMLVSYEKILTKEGFQVVTSNSAEDAQKKLSKDHNFSLVISDLKMPGMDGMELIPVIKEHHPHLPIIMVTGFGTLDTAIESVKSGAFDFIEKPFTRSKLLDSINKALVEIQPGTNEDDEQIGFDNIVGQSIEMKEVFEIINRVANGNANVLVTGESGVGKELVARSIHKRSLRRNRPIIPINCGALPDSLFESELFGYEKGAFTGAFQSKPGLVELANGGTLFLDEVCEMSHALQVKMLRMLEDHKIWRVGGKKEIPVDIRVVCATNRNLDKIVESGALREDFFYRIDTIQILVPPLRKREGDIPILAHHFLQDLNQKYNRQIVEIEPKVMEIMEGYQWPGNVRELQNVIERTYYLANPPAIRRADLPTYLSSRYNNSKPENWEGTSYREAKDQALEDFERKYLAFQLKKHGWNISKTATSCEMDRRTLHRLLKRYDIKKSK